MGNLSTRFRAALFMTQLLTQLLTLPPAMASGDAGDNHYEALRQFLAAAGYWDDESLAVLGPLDGVLTLGGGTGDVHLVEFMDDIPGLRPLPDGAIEFIHGHPDVIYLAVGRDRLLVGITRKAGPLPRFQFEKFDLIEGGTRVVTASGGASPVTPFLFAHGRYLAHALFLLVMGTAVMVFLAARLRRRAREGGAPGADPLVAALRRAVDVRVYLVTGAMWLGMLSALYGLMHFTGRLRLVGALSEGGQVSYRLADTMGFQPEHLRLISFIAAMGVALAVVTVLAIWSGALIPRKFHRGQGGGRP